MKAQQKYGSIDLWYKLMTSGKEISEADTQAMLELLKQELPQLSSLIMERTCNLSCSHCVFRDEKSSKSISEACNLEEKILTIAKQLPKNASIIHEGRILRHWHIPILAKIRELRPDLSIGLIDNGTYLRSIGVMDAYNFKLDWLDISIDGTEKVHNRQRNDKYAYDFAIKGLSCAHLFVRDKGRITSLFTATKINYANVLKAARPLMEQQIIGEFHITPMGPTFREGDLRMDAEEWKIFWEEVKETHALGSRHGIPVYLRIYNHHDIEMLAQTVGYEKFAAGFLDTAKIQVSTGSISFIIDGLRLLYIPISICCTETFVIDADGSYRLAYCVKFTLEELQKQTMNGTDISTYTVATIETDTSLPALYEKGAEQWWRCFGLQKLSDEKSLFQNLLAKGGTK